MAEQGLLKFERVFDGHLLFYRVKDRYFIRRKSQLTAERVKTSQEFTKTMASANRLKISSQLAASVYRELPEAWKMYELYQKLTGFAIRLQKEGKRVTEIRPLLEKQLYDWGYRKEIDYPTIKPTSISIKIRSAEECKEAEAQQPIKQKSHPSKKLDKRKKQQTTCSKKCSVRIACRKYSIRRNRKPAIFTMPTCNRSYRCAALSGSPFTESTLRTKPP